MTASPGRRLRDLLALEGPVICPGAVSPLFARIAERAGFSAVYATGAGISNTWLGLPDVGLMGMTELLGVTARITDAVSVPVIADIDTGYGNALNVTRTVREFERAGVAAVQIEDQINPKRCGHFNDKAVTALDEMVERIVAATEARRDPDLVVIARTDALATDGLAAAIDRAQRFAEAGADMIFVEAPTSREEIEAIAAEVKKPMVINMVEGGKTPVLPAAELAEMGYKVILYANTVLRMTMAAARRALETLHERGDTLDLVAEMAGWQERQAAVDLDEWLAIDGQVSARAARVLDGPGEGR
ncbi:carboxyvinyl-carboxyphosphonate phosphorylmutase [Sphaerisporangium rufum]|uniref:2-methylisocitrate lyase n=1 Tax=Sphaerisporangium rufum TaxID=1381558 RepID=A0A919QZ50_9ACTN|nr:oxaloacetate decarboxylase [Sphaerisporangium rufum]GII75998.1 carboxyvinyl-carboxyphosphonate phosphorylmutase [Sphaerisporangium rufum]